MDTSKVFEKISEFDVVTGATLTSNALMRAAAAAANPSTNAATRIIFFIISVLMVNVLLQTYTQIYIINL